MSNEHEHTHTPTDPYALPHYWGSPGQPEPTIGDTKDGRIYLGEGRWIPIPETTPAPAKRRSHTPLVLGLVVLALVLAAGALLVGRNLMGSADASTAGATGQTVTGTFDLAHGCYTGDSGYADIEPGLPVTLTDEKGTILGQGALSQGSGAGYSCEFTWSIPAIPTDRKFYSVEIGTTRGKVTESRAQLAGDGWHFETHLGN